MMLTRMLDTNICVYVMKSRPPSALEQFNRLAEQLCISCITLGELQYGVEKSTRREQNALTLANLIARMEVLHFDEKAAAHYGQLRAELERAGTPCGSNDLQIGAHARSAGLIVVTNNRREFDRMPGLRVENWI